MDRKRTSLFNMSERKRDDFVPGTPSERVDLAWELTREACSLSGRYDADEPMRRDVTRLIRLGSRTSLHSEGSDGTGEGI